MISLRQWIALLLAGSVVVAGARAQEQPAEGAASPGFLDTAPVGGAGPSSSFGPTVPGTSALPPTTTPVPADPGFGTSPTPSPSFDAPDTTTDGVTGGGAPLPDSGPPAYSLPGFYGQPGSTFVGGAGRLARPRYVYSVRFSQGYDDNIFQTPSNPERFPDQVVQISAGTPDRVTLQPVTTTVYVPVFAGPIIYYRPVTTTTFRQVIVRGEQPEFRTIKAPEPEPRRGSMISRGSFEFTTQLFTPRTLFVFDLNAQTDYYWNRPGSDKQDNTGSISFSYLSRITPRLQFSAAANIAYLSQPDFQRLNTPDRVGSGDYINGLLRLNLAYRWTPRISSTFSLSENALYFVDAASENGNSFDTTFGTELRYLWKPRYTLVGEYRFSQIIYPNEVGGLRDSMSHFALIGGDLTLSTRLVATVRLGEVIRTFEEGGDSSVSPYAETTLSYRIGPTSTIQWTSRYGFEEPPDQNTESLSYRSTVSYLRNFTPRLSANATVTGIYRTSTNNQAEVPETSTGLFDSSVGFEYHFTRNLTMNANATFTKVLSDVRNSEYDRSRLFVGMEYRF